MRTEDVALAQDLRNYGASVLAMGHELPPDAGDLVLQLPSTPALWQFLVDIIPIQVAAEALAQLRGENCDAFRICAYIVEAEGGLTSSHAPGRNRSR
jgi:fructoselysine-6-P-deglycase FrlB-like protein